MKISIIGLLPVILACLVHAQAVPANVVPAEEAVVSVQQNDYLVAGSGLSTSELNTTVDVYNHKTGKTMTLPMPVYLQGVVGGEMSGEYPLEALKAQAVAARTYVYYLKNIGKRHPGGACVCTSHDCCQAWTALDESWEYYDKIQCAVEETQGIVITYERKPILAMYFSSSGGHTENYTDVWGDKTCAYLQSVPSKNEQAYSFFDTVFVQEFHNWTVLSELRSAGYSIQCDSAQLLGSVQNIVRSDTGRVISMEIGGVQIPGTAVRECLGLRSTHFYFQGNANGGINIITIGFGHGVGMSQCGAAAMAEEGYDYADILHHYYTDVELEWMAFR